MKWGQSFEIHIKKSLLDKIVSDNSFNDLTPRENRFIKIRYISHFDEKVNIFVDVLDFIDSDIISRLVNIYKKDIDIYDYFWSDYGGYYFSSSIHGFYDDEVKWRSLEEEKVLGVDDRDTLIKLIKRNNESYLFIPDKYKYDVGFNLEVIDSFDFFRMLPDEMKLNRDILLKCLTNKGKYQDALELSLFENCDIKEMFLVAIKTDDSNIYYIPKVFWSDREFVLKVLEIDKKLIDDIYSLLSDELRIDDEIVDIYADYWFCDIKKLDKRVKKTDELVKKMIFSNLSNLRYTKFKNDVDFVNELLDKYSVLEYAGKEIRNNYDIVLKSVKRDPYSLKYASNELRNNYDIVLESVKKEPYSLKYASDELRNNKEIVELAVIPSYDSGTFMYAGDALKNNLEFIEKLLDNEYVVLEYCSDEIKNNYDIVLKSIKRFPYSLKYASDELRNNIDIVKCAVLYTNYDCKILECVGDKIKNDKDFMRDFFINCNCNCKFEFTDKRIRKYRRLFKLNYSDLIIEKVFSADSGDIVGVMVKEFFCYMSNHLLEDLDYIQSLIDDLLPFY